MENNSQEQNNIDFARQLHNAHSAFLEKKLTHRRFKHADITPLLNALDNQFPFSVLQIGESVEKRAIYQVKAGSGPISVLLWSQMHGDESTATMALFDIFNFLRATNDGFDNFRKTLLTQTTLYFVPMLNPDGAERFQRRNALNIDLNRDALRLASPEARLLKRLQQTLKPLVGFNLHDQHPRYSVGKTGQQATLSFLATAYDEDRNLNDTRIRSMQLIAGMNQVLQSIIPGRIGRYDDEFEPRAFGDNIQKWGTTLILIESGGYPDDPEKQYIRTLNFVAILSALKEVAESSYHYHSIDQYQAIPENGKPLFDLLIRNAQLRIGDNLFTVDLGINRYEENDEKARHFYYRSEIVDMGDLSTFDGLAEIDATGLQLGTVGVYDKTLDSVSDLDSIDLNTLRLQGIAAFRLKQMPPEHFPRQAVLLIPPSEIFANQLQIGQSGTFILWSDKYIKYLIVNGFEHSEPVAKPVLFDGSTK